MCVTGNGKNSMLAGQSWRSAALFLRLSGSDLRILHPSSCCGATESVRCERGDLLQRWFMINSSGVLRHVSMGRFCGSSTRMPAERWLFCSFAACVCVCVFMHTCGMPQQVKASSGSWRVNIWAHMSERDVGVFYLGFGFCSHSHVQFSKLKQFKFKL